MATKIVILNGAGSSGKSSIAREMQSLLTEPYLHVQMDTFLEMMPERYQDHPDGFSYATEIEDGNPSVVIRSGETGERTLRGMRYAVAALASQGNNLIVDDVMLEGEASEYAELLSAHDCYFVGVITELAILERREKARGNRMIGLARWQVDRVHAGNDYHLTVDTNDASPKECAVKIISQLNLEEA